MRITTILVVVFLVTMSTWVADTLAGDEVYRWVDEDGVVHFGEEAVAPPGAEQVEVTPHTDNTLDASLPTDSAETTPPYNTESSRAQQQRDERAARQKLYAEQQQQAAAECEKARQRVARLEPTPDILEKLPDGSVTRMDDNRRLTLLAEAKAYIAENCGI